MKRAWCVLVSVVFCLALCASVAQPAWAADTIETFDAGGLTDVEAYAGFEGLGNNRYQRLVSSEVLLGVGIIDRLSLYVAGAAAANEYFNLGEGSLALGLFGTPVDTDYVDLDLILNVGFNPVDPSSYGLSPGFELNLDLDPDMASFGLYLRAGLAFGGLDATTEEGGTAYRHTVATALNPGMYYTVADGHQLLLEYDMEINHTPEDGDRNVEVGGLALGYNVGVHDRVELISQVYLDIPQDDENVAAGVMVGAIFSP